MKTLVLLLISAAALTAQVSDGDVVDALTGAPIAGVHVSGQSGSSPERVFAVTDASGHFRFNGALTPYGSAMAVHPGYLQSSSNGWTSGGRPPSSVRIELTPQAVISGKLEDDDGFPVDGGAVVAARYRVTDGVRQLGLASHAESNDRGEFRLAGLSAGRYYLCISAGKDQTWDRRYSGECEVSKAKPVDVKAGQELNLATVHLTRHDGVTVSGHISSATGPLPIALRTVILNPAEGYRFGFSAVTNALPDGTFAFRHVAPGNYSLRTMGGSSYPPHAGDWYVEKRIAVEASDTGAIELAPREIHPVTLAGKVVYEDGTGIGGYTLVLRPSTGPQVIAKSGDEGAFEAQLTAVGHYGISVMPAMPGAGRRAATAVSARLGDREVLSEGFDLDGSTPPALRITASDRTGFLTGQLVGASGKALIPAAVLLVGAAGRTWVNVTNGGNFGSSALAPGDYRAYVLMDESQIALLDDPDYLATHRGDFPIVHVVSGANPEFTLHLAAAQ